MDDKEAARKKSDPIVVSSYPDVCKSPVAPVPYPIFAPFTPSTAVASTVRATGVPTFTMQSRIPSVIGDEAGVGLGVKSGTHAGGGVCEPTGSSSSVRAEKSLVVRNGDPFLMNNGNTKGKVVYQPGSGDRAEVDADGKPTKNTNPPAPPETPKETGFWAGFKNSAGEAWTGIKGQAQTAWDATGITATPEAASAARGAIWDGTKSLGGLARDATLASSPATMFTPWGQEAAGRLGNTATAVGGAIKDRYVSAYNEGGLSQALGVGTFDVARIGVEALGAKGAGLAVEGLSTTSRVAGVTTELADAANLARKAEQTAALATKAEQTAALATKAEETAALATKAEETAAAAKKAEEVAAAAKKAEEAELAAKAAEDGKDGVRVLKKPKGPPDTSKVKYPDDMTPYQKPDGTWDWKRIAPNDGFADGIRNPGTLEPGTMIDRYGGDGGRFFSPEGTPFEQRSLPPTSMDPAGYRSFEVLKPIPMESGPIAPVFGQPGGGTQFFTGDMNVKQLLDGGYIRQAYP